MKKKDFAGLTTRNFVAVVAASIMLAALIFIPLQNIAAGEVDKTVAYAAEIVDQKVETVDDGDASVVVKDEIVSTDEEILEDMGVASVQADVKNTPAAKAPQASAEAVIETADAEETPVEAEAKVDDAAVTVDGRVEGIINDDDVVIAQTSSIDMWGNVYDDYVITYPVGSGAGYQIIPKGGDVTTYSVGVDGVVIINLSDNLINRFAEFDLYF